MKAHSKFRFPNRVIAETYIKARGREFNWSPTRQKFTEINTADSDFNYSAMIWLMEHDWLVQLPFNAASFATVFKMKD